MTLEQPTTTFVHRSGPTLYVRLAFAVIVINAAVMAVGLHQDHVRLEDGTALRQLSALTLVNLAVAVLVRQQLFLNALYGWAGRADRALSLPVRRLISSVHHIGGLHVGCAVAGTGWMLLFASSALLTRFENPELVTPTTTALCVGITIVLLVVTGCASPIVRMRAHNVFEQSHRWGGWFVIAMYIVLTVHLAVVANPGTSVIRAMASDWRIWIVALLTASVAWPWLRLRRVPITVERPSRHVAIVTLDYGIRPVCSSAVGISLRPLHEWHAFATVTTPGLPGYRLLISRAGDWTGRFIDDPPTHVWVRGVPVSAPMAKVAVLYERVVYVVTGSGIGPCLGQILANRVPARLVWSTRNPRRTYGDALVDEVAAVQPDATIWDTTERGKPDLLQLALDAVREFAAEAVFIVSNKPTTLTLVDQLERHGVPAFGPIWDS